MPVRIFKNQFHSGVNVGLQQSSAVISSVLTEADLQTLPAPVQRCLRHAGVVDQSKVKNARIESDGEMHGKGKSYFPFTSVRYNFFTDPTRLLFMRAGMPGLPVYGYHHHAAGTATMIIRLLGLFTVSHQEGDTRNKAETVTLFNDVCLPAPATLIDQRIHRAMLHDSTVRGTFTNGNIIVSAVLYFGEDGKLVNFISGDRTDVTDMRKYPCYRQLLGDTSNLKLTSIE